MNESETLVGLNTFEGLQDYVRILDITSKKQDVDVPVEDIENRLTGTIDPSILEVTGAELRSWNSEGNELWGSLSAGAYVEAFWKLYIDTGEIITYSDFPEKFPNGVSLNPDKELVAYADKPLFFDMESDEAWEQEHETYGIYVYSLKNKTSQRVATLPSYWPGGMVNPLLGWDSTTNLQYSTPNGMGVYTYSE